MHICSPPIQTKILYARIHGYSKCVAVDIHHLFHSLCKKNEKTVLTSDVKTKNKIKPNEIVLFVVISCHFLLRNYVSNCNDNEDQVYMGFINSFVY